MKDESFNETEPFFLKEYWHSRNKLLGRNFLYVIFHAIFKQVVCDINNNYAGTMNYKVLDKFIGKIILVNFLIFCLLGITNTFLRLNTNIFQIFGLRTISAGEFFIAFLLACILILFYFLVNNKIANHYLKRLLISVTLSLFAYLFIFISGESTQMQFYYFVIIGILTMYADWRLIWIILAFAIFHHYILNFFQPDWILHDRINTLRIVLDALPLLIGVILASYICRYTRNHMIILDRTKKSLIEDIKKRKIIEIDLINKEKGYKDLVDYNSIGIIQTDLDGKLKYANSAFLKIVGFSRNDFRNNKISLNEMTPEIHKDKDQKAIDDLKKYAEARPYEKEFITKTGQIVPVLMGASVFDKNSEICICFVQDITAQKKAEKALIESKEYFQALVENSYDLILLTNEKKDILYTGPSIERVLGYGPDYLIGQNSTTYVHPDDLAYVTDLDQELISKPNMALKGEYRIKTSGGEWKWFEVVARNLLTDKTVNGIVLNYRDISEQKDNENKVYSLAFYDQLTGVANRTLFNESLGMSIEDAKANNLKVAILFIDLDRFKNINDTLGHRAGDQVLKEVSKRMQHVLKSNDIISRLGGDEFAIILSNINHENDFINVAERIIASLSTPFNIDNNEVYITPSIGISIYPNDTLDKDKLLMFADMAMYQAKKQVGNTYRIYSPELSNQYFEKIQIERNLRHAIIREEFKIYYQPKVNLKTRQMIGMEALIRWQPQEGPMISPVIFIPIAEETGLIESIGEWILFNACKETQKWHSMGFTDLTVSVNVSLRQMKMKFVDTVKEVLKQTGFDPLYLNLELTESDIMRDDEAVLNILQELKLLGITVSIDDFGTGYSSLSRISSLPIDSLKIDQSFIKTLNDSLNALTIVRAIVAMAKSLNLTVIAEGVENRAQYEFLLAEECDEIQGYYVSKPLSGPDFLKFMSDDCITIQ